MSARRLSRISPLIIRKFSSVDSIVPVSSVNSLTEKDLLQDLRYKHLALTLRVTELENQVKLQKSSMEEESNDDEKPFIRFQRKYYSDESKSGDPKIEIDFSLTKGQLIGGALLLMIGYALYSDPPRVVFS